MGNHESRSTQQCATIGSPERPRRCRGRPHVLSRTDVPSAFETQQCLSCRCRCRAAAAAAATCKDLKPDLLVLDIHLPDRTGVAAVPEIKRVSPQTRILLCTAYPSEDCIDEATKSGADGFVEKTNTWDDFMVAVDRVSRGQRYFCSGRKFTSQRVQPQNNVPVNLTPREREILTLVISGMTTKEIATQLFISIPTVEAHRASLMKKTGVRNAAGLVRFAIESQLTSN